MHPLVILVLCKKVGNCITTDFSWLLDHGLLAVRIVAYCCNIVCIWAPTTIQWIRLGVWLGIYGIYHNYIYHGIYQG